MSNTFLKTTFPQEKPFSGPLPHLARPKPYEYTYADGINPPEDWQLEDIEHMYQSAITRGYCANWNEMGCLENFHRAVADSAFVEGRQIVGRR
jgi:hypothetical protein